MSREFCPPYCNKINEPVERCSDPTFLSDGDRSKDRCWHLDDREYDQYYLVELVWTRDQTREALVVGENGDDYILDDFSLIKKDSPLIVRWL